MAFLEFSAGKQTKIIRIELCSVFYITAMLLNAIEVPITEYCT